MPAKIGTLHNKANEIIYPETIVSAVHMLDGKRDLQAEIEQLQDESKTIVFNNDGTITQTMTHSGMYIITEFEEGAVVETCYYSDDTVYWTMTTSFEQDGSIVVSKVYADNSEPEEEEGEGE